MKVVDFNVEKKSEIFREIEESGFIQNHEISYEQLVSYFILERYTVDQEIAINRQRETKPEEFKNYFDYCEQCKIKANESTTL